MTSKYQFENKSLWSIFFIFIENEKIICFTLCLTRICKNYILFLSNSFEFLVDYSTDYKIWFAKLWRMQKFENQNFIYDHASKSRSLLFLLQRLSCDINANEIDETICDNHMFKLEIIFLIFLRITNCFFYFFFIFHEKSKSIFSLFIIYFKKKSLRRNQ